MVNDRVYIPGDFYRICDRRGRKVRASETRKEWQGLIVHKDSWEYRQPQDFVRGVRDDQFVPEPRPRQVDVFLGPLGTQLTQLAAAGTTVINVISSVRMVNGDTVHVILDDGNSLVTTISGAPPTQTSIQLAKALPFKASAGNYVTDWSAIANPNIG